MFSRIDRKSSSRKLNHRSSLRPALEVCENRTLLSGNLIVNGSFEEPALPSGYELVRGGSTSITGWQTTLGGVERFSMSAGLPHSSGSAQDGQLLVDLNIDDPYGSGGGIEQAIPTTAEDTYLITFYLGTLKDTVANGNGHITVSAAGVSSSFSVINTTNTAVWTQFTLSFTATSSSSLISFTNRDPAHQTYDFLDNVSVSGKLTDIDMQSAHLSSGNTVQFTYVTMGNPGTFQVSLYPSADGVTFDSSSIAIVTEPITPNPTNNPATDTIALPSTWIPDPTKPFIVVDANPDHSLTESRYDNNTAAVELPDLVPSLARSAIHHLIYRGQTLSVPLIVNNQGGDATGNINIEYYLSTSQAASVDGPGNYLLQTATIDAATIPMGQAYFPPPVVTIPSFIVTATYYLKVRIVGAPVTPTIESDSANNLVVSEPLTLYSDTTTMMLPARATVYEDAVNTAKDPSHTVDSHSIQDFIKINEEGSVDHPALRVYDDRGNHAIGFGFDLDTKGKLHDGPQVQAILDSFHLLNDTGGPLTVQNLINNTGGIDRDASGRRDDLGLAVANKLFDLAYGEIQAPLQSLFPGFVNLSLNVRKALTDLAYNVGIAGIHKFTSLVRDVNAGNYAYAGFELVSVGKMPFLSN